MQIIDNENVTTQKYHKRSKANTRMQTFIHLILGNAYLEAVCCKKQQKKVPDQLLVCGIVDV